MFGYDVNQETKDLIAKVHELFIGQGYTLSAAESCTGGLISHYITTLAGASNFFRGAVVSYSNETKRDILGIPSEILHNYGAVSRETAREMAEKVRLLMKTDFSLSSTGNLGPDVLEGKEKGLVYVAACGKNRTSVKELRLNGQREANKEEAAVEALKLLMDLAGKQ